jgi:hypothetical protein
LAAAGFADFTLAAGFAFAAAAVTPNTDSFRALAGVKRSRVRAGILICAPVAGFRPTRAASLRLRKIPRPAKANRPFLFQFAHHEQVKFIEVLLRGLLADSHLVDQMAHHLGLRHHPLSINQLSDSRLPIEAEWVRVQIQERDHSFAHIPVPVKPQIVDRTKSNCLTV